jgi:hypothetical protein
LERLFFLLLLSHDFGVEQTMILSRDKLARVCHAIKVRAGLPRFFLAVLGVTQQQVLLISQLGQRVRQRDVATVNQSSQRFATIRRARMTRDKNQFALGRSFGGPAQVIWRGGWFAVFVNAEEANIEAIARILEVVHIAAEIGDRLLRSKYEADVRVLLVSIKVIEPALVKRYDVAAQAGFLLRLTFNAGDDRLARRGGLGRLHVGLHSRLHARRDVLDALEHDQFQAGAFQLFVRRMGLKTVSIKVASGRTQLLNCVGADMMIRRHQAARRHNRPAGARETHGRFHRAIEPFLREIEAIFLFQQIARRMVEEPHPLIGTTPSRERRQRQQDGENSFWHRCSAVF